MNLCLLPTYNKIVIIHAIVGGHIQYIPKFNYYLFIYTVQYLHRYVYLYIPIISII